MTMEIVNGIACFNCTDVEKAKKQGLNGTDAQDPLHPSIKIPSLNSASKPGDATGVDGVTSSDNQPLAAGDRGTKFNFAV